MKFLSLAKKLTHKINYYDKISPLPFDNKTNYNPFKQRECITMIWIENVKKPY